MRHRAPRRLVDLLRPRRSPAALPAKGAARFMRRPAVACAVLALLVVGGVVFTASQLRDGRPSHTDASRAGALQRSVDTPSRSGLRGPTAGSTGPGFNAPTAKPADTSAPTAASRPGRAPAATPTSSTRSPSPREPSEGAADQRPPDTTATTGSTTRSSWEVLFAADEPSSFECSLDGGAYQPCSSPVRYTELTPGRHTFAVRAVDQSGNRDPAPAELSWRAKGTGTAGGP